MHLSDPVFPPLLTGHDVKGAVHPFEHACRQAAKGKLGAGDVVWSRDVNRVDLAIVLEPEVPLAQAAHMMPLAMVAAGDCIGSLLPPQVAVTFTWPDIVRVNGGEAGRVRAAVPEGAGSKDVPDWLVVGLAVRHRRSPKEPEPGETPNITWLAEEGGGELSRTQLIESYCRHFLTWIHAWKDEGFRALHDSWLYRAHERNDTIATRAADGEPVTGGFLGLDENGNLLLKQNGKTRSLSIADYFERVGS